MEGMVPEPWKSLFLLTLFLLFITMIGAVTASSFLPERSASSEALRRVTFPVFVLLLYNICIWGWSIALPERVWMCWVFFAVVTACSLTGAVLWINEMRQRARKTEAPGAAGKEDAVSRPRRL